MLSLSFFNISVTNDKPQPEDDDFHRNVRCFNLKCLLLNFPIFYLPNTQEIIACITLWDITVPNLFKDGGLHGTVCVCVFGRGTYQ